MEEVDDSIRLVIEGMAGGETMVTLTATDPHGGEAEVSGQVVVVEPVLLWRDDFDFDNGEWSHGGSYEHRPGFLSARISDRPPNHVVGLQRREADNAVNWLLSMSVGVEEDWTTQLVGFWLFPPSTNYSCSTINYMSATVGKIDEIHYTGPTPGSNWQIWYYNCYPYKIAAYGNSDGVATIGEFSEIHWGVRVGRMEFFVGKTLVFSQDAAEGPTGNDDVEDGWPLILENTRFVGLDAEIDQFDQWIYFDWAELWGIPAY